MVIEEPKNKGNGLVIIVIILLLICLGLGGFIYLNKDKILVKQTKETAEKQEKEAESAKKIEYNENGYFIKSLMNKIINTDGYSHKEFQVYAKDKVTVDDLSDHYKNTLVLSQINLGGTDLLYKESLKEGSIKAFGKNIYSTYPQKFEAFCNVYTLNDTYYEMENPGCGGMGYRYDYNKITKIESDDNHIYIYQKAGFQGEDGINKNITTTNEKGYTEYVAKDLVKKAEFTDTINLDEILDQLNEYKFTFTYDETNNIYYFESVEKQ